MTDKGVSESVSWSLLWPAVMLVLLGVLQVGVWLHGRTVAGDAAAAAVDLASSRTVSVDSARAVALRVATAGGLVAARVEVERDSVAVRASVCGRVQQFFDVGLSTICEQSEAPVEAVP